MKIAENSAQSSAGRQTSEFLLHSETRAILDFIEVFAVSCSSYFLRCACYLHSGRFSQARHYLLYCVNAFGIVEETVFISLTSFPVTIRAIN